MEAHWKAPSEAQEHIWYIVYRPQAASQLDFAYFEDGHFYLKSGVIVGASGISAIMETPSLPSEELLKSFEA
ncbi:hypothetical protein WJT86_10555 [Microvirga sp. W0021]|uniref:Uncharacterized protein n=1 Tax=Hohaiivirga grylli TaxID=3133970 RepID=A0ABV0BMD7_9HYPH